MKKNTIEPKIMWEKWIDPFGQDIDESKWNEYETIDSYTDESFNETIADLNKKNTPVRVIASPLGLIPYNEYTASSKIFNFWVGHTNFDITKDIASIIEKNSGIEILDVFTRYRFRIGIGKCFEDAEVMKHINDSIYSYIKK